MNLPKSIAEFIESQRENYPSLEGIQICVDGETQTASPPLITIDETGSARTEQDGVPIRGVSTVSLVIQLHTVPADDGTTASDAKTMMIDLYAIIADNETMLQYIDGLHAARVLDIFCDSPTLSAEDGRRISTVNFEILAHPI